VLALNSDEDDMVMPMPPLLLAPLQHQDARSYFFFVIFIHFQLCMVALQKMLLFGPKAKIIFSTFPLSLCLHLKFAC
jgi:hypothetical protein